MINYMVYFQPLSLVSSVEHRPDSATLLHCGPQGSPVVELVRWRLGRWVKESQVQGVRRRILFGELNSRSLKLCYGLGCYIYM